MGIEPAGSFSSPALCRQNSSQCVWSDPFSARSPAITKKSGLLATIVQMLVA